MTLRPVSATWADVSVDDSSHTLFQKILLATDGTVTELLSLYSGQPVSARKLAQSISEAPSPAALQAGIEVPLLLRTVLLESADGRPLLHADSCFSLDAMPASIRRDLLQTDLPIGLLWRRERLEMFREILGCQRGIAPATAAMLQVSPDALLLRRNYRLIHHGQTMGWIEETFASATLK